LPGVKGEGGGVRVRKEDMTAKQAMQGISVVMKMHSMDILALMLYCYDWHTR
jgi:hypothetical protein